MTNKAPQPMTNILVSIPTAWVQQVDVIAHYYCKSRMTFIREFIRQGIELIVTEYRDAPKKLAEMEKFFAEMTVKADRRDEDIAARKDGW